MTDAAERVDPARAAELFALALEQPEQAREAFLLAEAGYAPALLTEVRALLAADAQADGFLEQVDAHRGAALLENLQAGERLGERVGPFRLLRELGRGGMGVVYLAERVDGGFEQQVAVKLVKRGMDSDAVLGRFRRERQILAALEHPSIARLIEGGLSADGRPYFAMEYVDGEPLTCYCDRVGASIATRLGLVDATCRAVQHAHARLVVHRDLKPSNVLVTPAGRPKLLDFGIAKLLGEGDDEAPTRLTRDGPGPLTPEYAAPEQLCGEPVSTVTDVYSLGVMLYELLTGLRPARGPEPEPPSAAVKGGPQPPAVQCGLDRNRLAQRLRGDLDTIVMRALAPEPERRYPSAEALAEDLERHLGGHPVLARRQTAAYRAQKFARRHRVGVAAAVTAVLALGVGLGAALWQARRAEREARRAAAVQAFLVDVFERADPTRSLGDVVTVRQLLDEGARRLRPGPMDDPTVRAELCDTLARTYRSLGRLDEASAWSGEAVAGFRGTLGNAHPRSALAELTAAEVQSERGEVAAARAALERLLPRLLEAYPADGPELRRARSARATLMSQTGEAEAAVAEERAILAAIVRSEGSRSVEAATQQGRVAFALGAVSRFDEALAAFRAALTGLERAGAGHSPQRVQVETDMADLLDRAGRLDEVEARFTTALATARSVLGPKHPQLAQTLIKYGYFLGQRGREAEAERALTEAIAILEPLGHYDAGAARRYLAFHLLAAERFLEAHAAFATAEDFLRAKLGGDHPLTWAAVVTTAYTEAKLGRVARAEARLREALPALERLHGPESDEVRVPRKWLGEVVRLAGRPREAAALHREVLALERRLRGTDETLAVAVTKHQLALDLLDVGGAAQLEEARRLADEALAFVRASANEPGRSGDLLVTSARIAAAQGHVPRAGRELHEAIALLAARRGAGAPSTRAARAALAGLKRG